MLKSGNFMPVSALERVAHPQTEITAFAKRDYTMHGADYLLWDEEGGAHFGWWELGMGLRDRAAMIGEMSQQVISRLGLPTDRQVKVAGFGCGAGGTERILAQAYPLAKVAGLSLPGAQLDLGQQITREKGLLDQVSLVGGDYFHPPFADASFDGVMGVEAWCYAKKMADIFHQAHRVLKPGGRVVVADALFRHSHPHPITQKIYEIWHHHGWRAVLTPKDQLLEELLALGFLDVRIEDISGHVIPTVAHAVIMATKYIAENMISSNSVDVQKNRHHLVAAYTTALMGACIKDVGYFVISATKDK